MPAKIITLSQKDQDLLRVVFAFAEEGTVKDPACNSAWGADQLARFKDLKERIL